MGKYRKKIIIFSSGFGLGLSFAPIFLTPALLLLSILCAKINFCKTKLEAFKTGYFFGCGFFLSSLYWIALGPSTYIDDFWWAIPLGLLGIPMFMALFIACSSLISWNFRNSRFYHFIFCMIWVFFEWLTSWILTGLPWSVLGYALSFSDILIQGASLFGIFGLSFIVVYVASGFYSIITKQLYIFKITLLTSIIACVALYGYGYFRLKNNQTTMTNIKVRLVQPSIPQESKWDSKIFWENLNNHIELSRRPGNPDIIIWSEAAMTVPFYLGPVSEALKSAFLNANQVLIFGSVSTNQMENEEFELYSSLVALNSSATPLFEYHKSHLVPFGEYIPYKSFLPFKKLTHGMIDYTEGTRYIVRLDNHNLNIQPLICYEVVFPSEVKITNFEVDLIINVTNDAWYGNSSGPYQHFEISRMRSVENGLPMLRVGNNGITAIIDSLGRVISSMGLNQYNVLDGYIPRKIAVATKFSVYGHIGLLILIIIVLILQAVSMFVLMYMKKD